MEANTAKKRKVLKDEITKDGELQILEAQLQSMRLQLAACTAQFELRCTGRANQLRWTEVSANENTF